MESLYSDDKSQTQIDVVEESYFDTLCEKKGYTLIEKISKSSCIVEKDGDRKFLRVELSLIDDSIATKKLKRSLRDVSGIKHPSIVTTNNAGYIRVGSKNIFYAEMDYVHGENLKSSYSMYTYAQLAVCMSQVAYALAETHKKRIIHRNIRPKNVVIEPRGGRDSIPKAYLVGFHVSKSEQSEENLTGQGEIISKEMRFIDPLRLNSSTPEYEYTNDQYAFGATLYYALTKGHMPYGDLVGNNRELFFQIIDGNASLKSIHSYNSEAPKELVAIVEKTMSLEEKERYKDMTILANELARFSGFTVDEMNKEENMYKQRSTVGLLFGEELLRKRVVVALTGLTTAVALAGFALSGSSTISASQEEIIQYKKELAGLIEEERNVLGEYKQVEEKNALYKLDVAAVKEYDDIKKLLQDGKEYFDGNDEMYTLLYIDKMSSFFEQKRKKWGEGVISGNSYQKEKREIRRELEGMFEGGKIEESQLDSLYTVGIALQESSLKALVLQNATRDRLLKDSISEVFYDYELMFKNKDTSKGIKAYFALDAFTEENNEKFNEKIEYLKGEILMGTMGTIVSNTLDDINEMKRSKEFGYIIKGMMKLKADHIKEDYGKLAGNIESISFKSDSIRRAYLNSLEQETQSATNGINNILKKKDLFTKENLLAIYDSIATLEQYNYKHSLLTRVKTNYALLQEYLKQSRKLLNGNEYCVRDAQLYNNLQRYGVINARDNVEQLTGSEYYVNTMIDYMQSTSYDKEIDENLTKTLEILESCASDLRVNKDSFIKRSNQKIESLRGR